MGIVAFGRLSLLKLFRQVNEPGYVARGAAIGVLTAFFPIVGTHTMILAGLSVVLRSSFVAGMLFSMLANPWTIGPMWAGSFHAGQWLLGKPPLSTEALTHMNGLGLHGIIQQLDSLLQNVIFPTVIGGAVIGGPLAVFVYVIVYWQLRRRRARTAA